MAASLKPTDTDKQEVLRKYFGGSVVRCAREVGCKPSSVSEWPSVLPPRIRDRVQAALWRRQHHAGSACTTTWVEPPPHSACTLLPGDSGAVVKTAAELLVHRYGDDPPGEPIYRLNLRGEPGVYITRSDLLALMTGAAELLQLDLQPRVAPAEEAVLA